ncbi:MAG: DUF1987 domain-containing protein [Bacteroidales bacterium]|nr:DUF1987 domain-containing protein [Bacteroidales bacterium]
MDELIINGTEKIPSICFNSESGKLDIQGRSIPENSIVFYEPLKEWLDLYSANPKQLTEVHFKLEYFNTSSSKSILELLKILAKIYSSGNSVVINWYYEKDDDDMLEVAEDYESILKLPFNMIECEDLF